MREEVFTVAMVHFHTDSREPHVSYVIHVSFSPNLASSPRGEDPHRSEPPIQLRLASHRRSHQASEVPRAAWREVMWMGSKASLMSTLLSQAGMSISQWRTFKTLSCGDDFYAN